jgi:dynein assembly factor 3
MFWGTSEARNFYEEYVNGLKEKPKKLDILLFGLGDPCHLVKTLSKAHEFQEQEDGIEINFYIIEGCVELLARDLVLLNVALENDDYFSVNAKTHLYMDLFGNSLLRSASYLYLCSKSEQFLKLITDPEFAETYAPIFNFENLKYKEKDQLEKTFNFYKNKKEHVFDIAKYWDEKNRYHLKERYDHRYELIVHILIQNFNFQSA